MSKDTKRTIIYQLARLHLEERSPERDADYNFLFNVLEKTYRNKINLILDIVARCVMDFKLHGKIVRYK